MQLQQAANGIFVQLAESIVELTSEQYQQTSASLSGNTVGQHVRHIIDLFQCLENGYASGTVDYDHRKRDKAVETDKELACRLLKEIAADLNRSNKKMILLASFNNNEKGALEIETNYYREVAYNLEHTIHHMALMRVGISEVSEIRLPADYGMASSTIKHRKECAQ